jgi:hypothetical protein
MDKLPELKMTDFFDNSYSKGFNNNKETNFDLSSHLSALQFRTMMHDFIRSGVYDRYSYLLRGVYADCKDFSDFFPASGESSLVGHEVRAGQSVDKLKEEIRLQITEHFQHRKTFFEKEHGERTDFHSVAQNFDLQHLDRLARMRMVLESQEKKLDLSDYGLSEKPGEGSYNFSQGQFGINEFFVREFLPVFEKENPTLVPVCSVLAEESRKKLSL